MFQRKTCSKMLKSLEIQALKLETLTSMPKVYEGNYIITNLSNNLSHTVGALKRDSVREQHIRFVVWEFYPE
jgi:hypothetical protein